MKSFAERLAEQMQEKPGKEVYNGLKKPYDWKQEANAKRPIR